MQKNRSSETVKFRLTFFFFKADDDMMVCDVSFFTHQLGIRPSSVACYSRILQTRLFPSRPLGLMSVYLFTPNRVAGRDQVMMELLNLQKEILFRFYHSHLNLLKNVHFFFPFFMLSVVVVVVVESTDGCVFYILTARFEQKNEQHKKIS